MVSLLKYFRSKLCISHQNICIPGHNFVFPNKVKYFQWKLCISDQNFCIFYQIFLFPIKTSYLRPQLCISRPSPAPCISRQSFPANKVEQGVWITHTWTYTWHGNQAEVKEGRPAGRQLADRDMHIPA